MVHAVIQAVTEGGAPSCMWIITSLLAALGGSGLIIAKLATALWSERMARITYLEAINAKIEEERAVRDVTRAIREREKKGGAP